MSLSVFAILCWILILPGRAWGQGPLLFHFTLSPGPHAVGLKVVDQYDESRTWFPLTDELGKFRTGNRARPLQTLIWYPAEKNGAKPMTVGDYANLMMTETSFDKPDPANGEGWKKAMKPTLGDAMLAVRDAPASRGRYPVVIYAPSFGAMSWENADLCEYLASHGYLVIGSTALGFAGRRMTNDLPGVEAQARDISFLIGYAQSLPNADVSEVAVGGFSWGGLANLFAAAHDNRIEALFCLDGSLRYWPGLVKDGNVHPDQMAIPLLFFTEGEFTLEGQALYMNEPANQGPSVLNAWTHGDLITVHMLGMMHVEFSSMFQRNEGVWKESKTDGSFKADYGRSDGIPGYAWVSRYTLAFLDAYLQHDGAAMDWLRKTPAENGVPQHFLSVDFRAAKGLPPTLEGFRGELGRKGFDHASEIYSAMKKDDPGFKIDEDQLERWGDALSSDTHPAEAIAILALNVSQYPDSSGAYAHLAEAYAKAGQKQQAIDNYRKAVEKDPDNEDAKKRLADLEKPAS